MQPSSSYDPTETGVGNNLEKPMYFIQEAINAIIAYQETNLNDYVSAIIYLGNGDHFHFTCDGDENDDPLDQNYVSYCAKFGTILQQRYSLFDKY